MSTPQEPRPPDVEPSRPHASMPNVHRGRKSPWSGFVLIGGFGLVAVVLGEIVKLVMPGMSPLVVAALAVAFGLIPLVIGHVRKSADGGLSAPRLVGLVVVGGVAYGMSWGIGWFTGNEEVVARRLVEPAASSTGSLTVTVDKVDSTSRFTKVHVVVVNSGDATARIAITNSCQLVDNDGGAVMRLDGLVDLVRESWFLDVPPGGVPVEETIGFRGQLAAGATSMTLTCGDVRVFGMKINAGQGGPAPVPAGRRPGS